ncbi:PAS domain-containing protein [Streptomyces sp. VRA16 Mangrove soil]|uniref:PAS domain-containing protein n=1 Tax=Streptomyces sp. VRA16 Mangrove soil TaxID=2817434 RepID=UPI001A9DF765|nr:PAS domain-containing protein [Streptomyces sp. VRA16 Mangrove soil]MBO1331087.1 PAS domain-containing protein [Streptomyces sp. VRA16 Mangrove soil]
MAQMEEFGEELADLVRRVAELKAARSVPTEELPAVLDAALFELDHAVRELWPWYERLTADSGGPSGRSAGADRQEQQLLRAVFQRLPLPVALVDRECVVRRLNFAATNFTGVRAGYATGRPLTGLLAHADRAAFRSQVAAVARGEGDRGLTVHLQQSAQQPVRVTLTGLRPGNEPRTTVLVLLQPGDDSSVPLSRAAATPLPDLTETSRHQALMDLMDAMTRELLAAPAGDPAEVLRRAARVLHARFADWVTADTGAARLSRVTVLGADDAAVRDIAAQDPASAPLVVEAARGGAPTLLVRPEDAQALGTDASGAPVLVRADVTSLLCVPLIPSPGEPVQGVLTLFRSAGRLAFSMAEAQALDVMSRHIALAMGRRG